ncbi:Rrf2 family transcriptional regulator [Eggerthellaceae bacterium zg-1084]|uniref:Rrf2 family transcriptional regulator n=1 Tax=Berryella wangjianweii TaxID=2734634 RepID=A0A6M8J7C0_9ACTN|nr:Rrf2 family transcriptional regulator [Berryella wangjianweii]NPD31263.1 Rrf2 family transcriptional regulator [Berryella wangjianweii]NPD32428.1 Rrf2 family transcriptional regulator [Eggerthellaceae bacterium zg-997]QKF06812.1 Rrf2 family transcriptional regulator [Berryella wangjianweii]
MRISTKGVYAVRLMVYLTQKGPCHPVSLKEVADTQGISKKYLEQIAPSLTGARLLKATRGAAGGYQLARDAAQITMFDILSATEGSLSPSGVDEGELPDWGGSETFLESAMWRGFDRVVCEYLSGITLQQIFDEHSPVAADSYTI